MNRKTLLLIFCLSVGVVSLFLLKLWLSKREPLPSTPEVTLPPKEQLTPTPTIYPFISPISFITPPISPLSSPTSAKTLILTPTPKIVSFPTIIPSVKNATIRLLPIAKEGYLIEYLSSSKVFFVTITNLPIEQNRQEVERWFETQGINPQHPDIVWNLSRNLNPKTP